MLLKMSKEKVSVESDLCGRYNVPEVQSSEVQWPRVKLYRGTNFFIIEFNYSVPGADLGVVKAVTRLM